MVDCCRDRRLVHWTRWIVVETNRNTVEAGLEYMIWMNRIRGVVVRLLQSQGLKPGIVSRGYGADSTLPFPRLITPESDVNSSGDEPKLLALRSGAPVVISPKRAEAVEYLRNHSNVDVVISDDGLQHYEMARALEIVLVDGNRQFGNGFLLPTGPLREPRSRLESTDLVVFNEGFAEIGDYRLQTGNRYSLKKTDLKLKNHQQTVW